MAAATKDVSRPAIGAAQAVKDERTKTVAGLLSDEGFMVSRLKEIATKHLPAERAVRLAIGAVRRTPMLASCDATSFFGALMSATGFGLEPNTPAGLAYLIPYKKRVKVGNNWQDSWDCQFQIGYKGFVELMYRQPDVNDLTAECIYSGDIFDHQKGTESFLRYRKMLVGNRGEPVGAFCFVNLRDGNSFTVLPIEEILKIRSRSQTWTTLARAVEAAESEKDRARAEARLAETPWEMWFPDMAAKSAIKKHAKQMRTAPDLTAAAAIDSVADSHGIGAMADVDFAKAVLSGDEDIGSGDLHHDDEGGEGGGRPQITKSDEKPADPAAKAADERKGEPAAKQAEDKGKTAAEQKPAASAAAGPATTSGRRQRGTGLF